MCRLPLVGLDDSEDREWRERFGFCPSYVQVWGLSKFGFVQVQSFHAHCETSSCEVYRSDDTRGRKVKQQYEIFQSGVDQKEGCHRSLSDDSGCHKFLFRWLHSNFELASVGQQTLLPSAERELPGVSHTERSRDMYD